MRGSPITYSASGGNTQAVDFGNPFRADAVKIVLYSVPLPDTITLREIDVWSTITESPTPTLTLTSAPTSVPTGFAHPWELPCAARPWSRGEAAAVDSATEAPFDHGGLDDEFDKYIEIRDGQHNGPVTA